MTAPVLRSPVLRRGALFLLGIGLPLCLGVMRGEHAGALLGAICGMLLSFADDSGPLPRRFVILALTAAAIAVEGATGAALHGFAWPVWPLFVVATFATGQFNRFGKAPVVAGRFGAMALIVTSGSPELNAAVLVYPLLALAAVSAGRLADHAAFGPMPAQAAPPRSPPPGGWTRFAVTYAAASVASLWVGVALDPVRALWVVVTTLVVMQSDARASYVRIVHRIGGTVLGVSAAFALSTLIGVTPWAIAGAILVVAPFIPHHLQRRYWLHTALIALVVLLAYDLAAADLRVLRGLFTERLQDVLLGSGIALIGTMIAFPRTAPDEG